MTSNILESPLRIYSAIPRFWAARPRVMNYDKALDLHHEDGWRPVITPAYDAVTQKLGALYYDHEKDVVTQQVIDKTPEEIEAENRVAVPFSIAPAQGRLALARRGLLAAIQNAIPTDVENPTRIYWEYAISWERSHPLINQLAAALGLTEAEVDEIFIEAATGAF